MANEIIRERTKDDDYWSNQYKTYQTYEPLFKVLSDVLSIGGGIAGAYGTKNPAGALVGAGLGKGAGKSIDNLFKQQLGYIPNQMDVLEAIPEGMAQEAGGQLLGRGAQKVASTVLNRVSPKETTVRELIKQLKKTPEGELALEFHGGSKLVPNPKARARTGVGGDEVFFTTEERPMAELFAEYRSVNDGPFAQPAISEYYTRGNIPSLNISTPSDAFSAAKRFGLSEKEFSEAYKNAYGINDSKPMGRIYTELVNSLAKRNKPPLSIREGGQVAADMLKKQGIEKIVKPIDIGGMETLHFYPERNLFYKPTLDKNLVDELAKQDINENMGLLIRNLIEGLKGPAGRTVPVMPSQGAGDE